MIRIGSGEKFSAPAERSHDARMLLQPAKTSRDKTSPYAQSSAATIRRVQSGVGDRIDWRAVNWHEDTCQVEAEMD